jgi:hypothetical protein
MANAWLLEPLGIVNATSVQTALGSPTNIGNDYAGVIWRSAAGASEIRIDLGADIPIDAIMLFGLSGGGDTATLRVGLATAAQGNGFAGGSFWNGAAVPLYAGTSKPVEGRGVAIWTAPTIGPPAAARYVSLNFGGNTSPIQVSRAVINRRIQLERNYGFGGGFGVRDLGSLDFSRRGVLLRQRGAKLRTTALTFSNIRKDEVEATTKPLMERLGNTEMVALVTDPAEHPQRQSRCYYGPLVGDLGHIQRNSAGWEAKVNMVSIF